MRRPRKQKYVDIAAPGEPACESVSPNGKRCCYEPGHIGRGRPHYHCDAHGLESWDDPAARSEIQAAAKESGF